MLQTEKMSLPPQKETVKKHYDTIAKAYDGWKEKNLFYFENLKSFVIENIAPHSKVLEVGSGTGEFLSALKPQKGVGVDISPEMVKVASKKYPQYRFICSPIEDFKSEEKFDYIILIDVAEHVSSLMDVLGSVYKLCHPTTQIILTTINPFWGPFLALVEKFDAKAPEGPHKFISTHRIIQIMKQLNFSIHDSGYLLLLPKHIPILSYLANTIGTKIWGLNKLSFVQYVIAQPNVHEK